MGRAYAAIEKSEMKDLAAYLQTYIQPGGSYDLSYAGERVWDIVLLFLKAPQNKQWHFYRSATRLPTFSPSCPYRSKDSKGA
jgi:hypothetical protein